jgi:predicted nuclease with TOPRIM domain
MSVETLKMKVEDLVGKHQQAIAENQMLKEKNTELASQLSLQAAELAKLKETNKVLKLSESVRTKGDAREANLKINELVREIDKCIAQLNR